MKSQPLTSAELEMWIVLMRSMSMVNRNLAMDMRRENGIHITWYDVLIHLYNAPGFQLSMGELADEVIISGSGLTRLLDKMVDAELVDRVFDKEDRRLVLARLTPAGQQKAAELMKDHQLRLKSYLFQHLRDDEISVIQAAFERVLATCDPKVCK